MRGKPRMDDWTMLAVFERDLMKEKRRILTLLVIKEKVVNEEGGGELA